MSFADFEQGQRLLLIIGVAVGAHLLVMLIRKLSTHWMILSARKNRRKLHSVVSLVSSSLVFTFYFAAFGFILSELGVPIATYFASASIIGLAVGFGSQGLVQDVVSGLTIMFSDVFDVGDLVEIGGQVGVIRQFGLRFVDIENAMGARVLIPNRSITNVINYRSGYLRCLVDITLVSRDKVDRPKLIDRINALAEGVRDQFPGILVTPPHPQGEIKTSGGREFYRLKFRIWPGRGAPLEQSFRQEVIQEMKSLDPDYSDWMVAVYYEVEQKHR